MNILLLGSGGREHALAWKISQSKHCTNLFIAPGNAGTSQCGRNINISVNNFESVKKFSIENNIEMIVVGPEEPLVKGIYDYFEKEKIAFNQPVSKASPTGGGWRGLLIGPSAAGAQLEGSKAFSKKFMLRHKIPTATHTEFTREDYEEGKKYIAQHSLPVVLKAD